MFLFSIIGILTNLKSKTMENKPQTVQNPVNELKCDAGRTNRNIPPQKPISPK
jgi:hypothetical protein